MGYGHLCYFCNLLVFLKSANFDYLNVAFISYKTFPHWPRLDTLFTTQAWISLRCLPEAKDLRERCLRSVSFIGQRVLL